MISDPYSHIDIYKTEIINQGSLFHDGYSLKRMQKKVMMSILMIKPKKIQIMAYLHVAMFLTNTYFEL